MANHASAIKRQKQSIKRNARNRAARTRIKNVVKAVRAAVQNNDKAAAEQALQAANSTVAKIASKGVHPLEERCSQGFPPRQGRQRHGIIRQDHEVKKGKSENSSPFAIKVLAESSCHW